MGSLYIKMSCSSTKQHKEHKAFSALCVHMHTQIQSLASPDRKAVWLPHSGINGFPLNLLNVAAF